MYLSRQNRRSALESHRKVLGQHFLRSRDIAKDIISKADLRRSDIVLEIGTGSGTLTREISPHVNKVITYEKDPALFSKAVGILSCDKNINLIEGDIFEKLSLSSTFDVCITSLPYSRSLDFIHWLAEKSGNFRSAYAVLQEDFVDKIQSVPNCRRYRAVSVIAQLSFNITRLMKIDRSNFDPSPKVQSALVKFEANTNFHQPFLDHQKIELIVRIFSFRGRMLRVALRHMNHLTVIENVLPNLLIKRIEDLTPAEFGEVLIQISK